MRMEIMIVRDNGTSLQTVPVEVSELCKYRELGDFLSVGGIREGAKRRN
jgi:hypothetical protein